MLFPYLVGDFVTTGGYSIVTFHDHFSFFSFPLSLLPSLWPFPFNLPARRSPSLKIHSICPLVLRNSSAAHFSMAFIVSESMRRANGFLSLMLLMQCSCIYNRLGVFVAAKNNKQIAYHSCFLVLIKNDYFLFRQ